MWPAVVLLASVFSYPDEGSEAMGRAGAWVARASDPIALARNPAGLAGQPLRLDAGWDLALRRACMGDDCNDAMPFPVGFVTLAIPTSSERLTLGAGIVTPHGIPHTSFRDFDSATYFAVPTFGAAWAITPELRVGASVGWGMATTRTRSRVSTTYGDYDVTVLANDFFVPRATLGADVRAGDHVELGASLMASAPFDGAGEGRASAVSFSEHRFYDHVDLDFAVPAEASVGVRVKNDVADLELDTTWSNDDRGDVVGFRLGGDVNVVPDKLAIRAGAFFLPRSGERPAYEAMRGSRVGLSAGMTARLDPRFDLSLAALHVFIGDVGPMRDELDVMHLGVAYRF